MIDYLEVYPCGKVLVIGGMASEFIMQFQHTMQHVCLCLSITSAGQAFIGTQLIVDSSMNTKTVKYLFCSYKTIYSCFSAVDTL